MNKTFLSHQTLLIACTYPYIHTHTHAHKHPCPRSYSVSPNIPEFLAMEIIQSPYTFKAMEILSILSGRRRRDFPQRLSKGFACVCEFVCACC